jgi:hypothetical protein
MLYILLLLPLLADAAFGHTIDVHETGDISRVVPDAAMSARAIAARDGYVAWHLQPHLLSMSHLAQSRGIGFLNCCERTR